MREVFFFTSRSFNVETGDLEGVLEARGVAIGWEEAIAPAGERERARVESIARLGVGEGAWLEEGKRPEGEGARLKDGGGLGDGARVGTGTGMGSTIAGLSVVVEDFGAGTFTETNVWCY